MPTDSDSRKLERIEAALSNLEISADSVNLNTDGLEAKLDTANGILTTLSADTALLKADVADGVGVTGTFWPTTQPISGTVNMQDGAGNAITSTVFGSTRRLDVNLSSAGATGAAVPTSANLIGGTDGTTMRAISVDTSGRINTNALPGQGALNDYSGSITTASTSYNIVNANASRRYALVQNISDTGMWLNIGAAATTTNSIFLASNSGIVWESGFLPTATLSILCTTSGKRFVVKEI